MKRFALSACLLAAVAMPTIAHADPTTFTGSVMIGHPVTQVAGGVTENEGNILGDCSEAVTDGIDGSWVTLPEDSDGHAAEIHPTDANADLQDFDVYFYDASCGFIGDGGMAANASGEAENGKVPAAAVFAVVDMFTGLNGSYSLTVQDH